MTRHRRLAGDEGASLILVLVFMMSFALIVPALLTLAQTSISSVASIRDVTDRSNDARNAAEHAINRLRNGTYYNAPAQPCFHDPADLVGTSDSSALVIDGATTNTGKEVLVTCQAEAATGYPTSVRVPFTAVNTPGSALLTLSRTAGEDGIRHAKNNVLLVQGRVFSNSTINVTNSNAKLLGTSAPVYARGFCSPDGPLGPGTVVGTPTSCQDTAHDNLGVDPGYSLPTTLPAPVTAPACSSAKTYTLYPGTYTSASALNSLTKSSCGSPLLHFTSGTYYFDFAEATAAARVWDISAGYVIGGTIPVSGARAWDKANYPASPPPVPGACIGPTEETSNGGVQFIFGGDSRMAISGGAKVEICGPYSADRPPIAVFGANAGAGPITHTVTLKASNPKSSSSVKFKNLGNIKEKDGVTSDAQVLGVSNGSATVVATMLAGAIPQGAQLLNATLRVAHRDVQGPAVDQGSSHYPAGPVSSLTATMVAEKSGGGPSNPSISPVAALVPGVDTAASPIHEEPLDFTAALKPYFEAPNFTGVTTTFTAAAEANRSATEQLDSLQLDLTYERPAFRAQSGCVAARPYGSSGTCALIATNNNSGNQLYIQGTTYAPAAALDINLNNVSQQVFRFGLIARTVILAITGSSTFADAVISVPNETAGYGTTVPMAANLQVFICESGTCATPPVPAPPGYVPPNGSGWVRRLSTRVRVTDAEYPPTAGQRQVNVESWFHVR